MRKNTGPNRARSSSPMWYTAAADYARKRFDTQTGAMSTNRTTSGGQGQPRNFPGLGNRLVLNRNPVIPPGSVENVNGKKNKKRSLNNPLRNRYPVSRAISPPPAPQVVDMQVSLDTSELPIFRRNDLHASLSSASSVKSPAAKRLAAATEYDEDKGKKITLPSVSKVPNSTNASPEHILPLIMVEPSSKSKGYNGNEVSSKPTRVEAEESTEREEHSNGNNVADTATDITAQDESEPAFLESDPEPDPEQEQDMESKAETETEQQSIFETNVNDEGNDIVVGEAHVPEYDLEMDCKSSLVSLDSCAINECHCADKTGMCDECKNQTNILTSCAVTEAHYLSFPCEQSEENGEQSNCWNIPQLFMPLCMCSGQAARAACDTNLQTSYHNYGYPQRQAAPSMNFQGCTCCNQGTSWQRPNCRHQQTQLPRNSCCRLCSNHHVPIEHQKQQGLTELLAQQLREQMQQAQVQIAQVQMQLNSACCAPKTQKIQALACELGSSNSATIKHNVVEPEQELEQVSTRAPAVESSTLPLKQLPQQIPAVTPPAPWQQISPQVSSSANPMMTLGLFAVKPAPYDTIQNEESDAVSESDCESESSSLAQDQQPFCELPTPQCVCQQQQRRLQPKCQPQQLRPMHTPQCAGNHFNYQPWCRQCYGQMRFMAPRFW